MPRTIPMGISLMRVSPMVASERKTCWRDGPSLRVSHPWRALTHCRWLFVLLTLLGVVTTSGAAQTPTDCLGTGSTILVHPCQFRDTVAADPTIYYDSTFPQIYSRSRDTLFITIQDISGIGRYVRVQAVSSPYQSLFQIQYPMPPLAFVRVFLPANDTIRVALPFRTPARSAFLSVFQSTWPYTEVSPGNFSFYDALGPLVFQPFTVATMSPYPYAYQAGGAAWTLGPEVELAASTTQGDYFDPNLCVAACFDATYRHTTVPHYTLDTPRDVTVVYRGDRVALRPFLHVDLLAPMQSDWTSLTLRAQINGSYIPLLPGNTTTLPIPIDSIKGKDYKPLRISTQFDASTYATGVYPVTITLRMVYGNGDTVVKTTSTQVIIDNGQQDSAIAKGWGIAGLQRIHFTNSGYLVTDGDGTAVWYPQLDWVSADGAKLTYTAALSQYVLRYPDSTLATFNAAGRMTKLTDRRGLSTVFTYDGANRLTSIVDPMRQARGNVGPYLSLIYGTYGLDSVVEAGLTGGRKTIYTVNSSKRLTRITDPDTKYTDFTYHTTGRLTSVTDRRGGVTTLAYDTAMGKLTSMTVPSILLDNGSGGTTSTALVTTFQAWQTVAKHRPVPLDSITSRIIDPLGRTTTFTVNEYGQALTTTDPAGRITRTLREGMYPNTIIHPDTSTDLMTYDGTRLTGTKPSGGNWTYYEYGARNQVSKISGLSVSTVRRFLNPATGDPDSVVVRAPGGLIAVERYTYDAMKRVTSVRNAVNDTVFYAYDSVTGNLDSTRAPGRRWTKIKFDKYGRDSEYRAAGVPTSSVIYDAMNRDTAFYDGVNGTPTRITYDALFRTSIRNPKGQLADSTEYNALGWVTKRIDPYNPALARQYRYDAAGQLTRLMDRRGQTVTYQYDLVGRQLTRTYNGLTDTYTYDATTGGPATMANMVSKTTWTHPGGDRSSRTGFYLPNSSTTNFTVYRYYADSILGAIDSVVLSKEQQRLNKILTTRDDSTGLPTTLRLETLLHITRAYDVLSRRVGSWYGASPTQTFRNDSSHTTSSQLIFRTYTPVAGDHTFRRAYLYDSVGRITTVQAPTLGSGNTQTDRTVYAYDGLGQLTSVTSIPAQNCSVWPHPLTPADPHYGFVDCWGLGIPTTYTYDAAGNRTDHSGTYGAGNRVLTFGGFTFTHDAEGNIIRKAGTGVKIGYEWDALNRLRKVTDSLTGVSVQYDYDAADRLVRRTTGSVVDRYWLWNGDQLLLELNGAMNILRKYTHFGTDAPAVVQVGVSGGTARYPQQDALGNVIGTLDRNRNVTEVVQYDPWGVPTVVAGDTLTRLLWKGLLWEAKSAAGPAGLYYMRARWYDPTLGRFLSEDPLGAEGGLNRYVFAGNDPINGADPTGLRGIPGEALGWGEALPSVWVVAGPDHPEDVVPVMPLAVEMGAAWSITPPTEGEWNCRAIAYAQLTNPYWDFNPVLYAHLCDRAYPGIYSDSLEAWAQGIDPVGWSYWFPAFEATLVRWEWHYDPPQALANLCTDADWSERNGWIHNPSARSWACQYARTTWSPPLVSDPTKSSMVHIVLGTASVLPGIGGLASAADAGLYLYERDYTNAALSMAGVVPGIALVTKGAKLAKAANVAKGGVRYTKSSLSFGREMHKGYKAGLADGVTTFKEFTGIKGIRPDFVDFGTKTIYELKPFNPRSIQLGTKQLNNYKAIFEKQYPGTIWKTVLDTY